MTTRRKQPTIRDVARLADVSYQTVSLVINGKPGVSEKTRARIVQLMEDMDFHPNRAAQMLSTRRSNTLELVVVDVMYGGRLADSTKNMVQTARAHGYGLLISETDKAGLANALESAVARLVDGVLLYAPRLYISDDELTAIRGDIPLVRRDFVPGSKLAWVGFDQAHATRLAVEHLIGLGHRHIAALPPGLDVINGYWRFTTWKNVLLEHDLVPGPAAPGNYSMRSGYDGVLALLREEQPFTAIVVGSDNMALGALRALYENGLRVPHDISVIGVDNTEHSRYTIPQLTTVGFEFLRQDELSVKYLVELIRNPAMELTQRILQGELIVRESTRALDSAGKA